MDKKMDKRITDAMNGELNRQRSHIELIASENFVSEAVMECNGSVFTNKYAEGYPGRRYYGGCEYIDVVEQLGIDLAKKIFGADHANLQPHSGSQANEAAYKVLVNPGDKILSMGLNAGGHLTHGSSVNFSGKTYNFAFYGVDKDTDLIDYDEVERLAIEFQPKLIVAGASAYSRKIDFKRFKEIADKVDAKLMVDMAHIAGLVAAGVHESPVPYADVVTTTTHKTLRGSRGGMILCKAQYAKKIDSAVFPGTQGGPLENLIAGKTQALCEADTLEYKQYIEQVVINAKVLAQTLMDNGVKVLTNGTDNHLINFEVKESFGITGREAEAILESVGIVTNKELLPFDTETPYNTSGVRIGTPAMTTRGFKETEFKQVGNMISSALKDHSDENLARIKAEVKELCDKFPLYEGLSY
ncbi:serine hydroxymethyltransferase [Mesoplasma lactucae]|uniref:Serine hydroxymethyltransferase n=1 Tax=Mesoplasma lactucae ATCC 49193 TaxID=81460 RepID=A0A291ISP3_9MOLU|nr:serine hydroxymethyltransferase [Mesoplasma lactucae]ATG97829.1 serine hydroxymethyltransferase [Mesoplasma lactucae ATCC 49193]